MNNLKQAQIFTPPHITNQMLDMLDQSYFSDPEYFFFEPTCGEGDMLIVILERIYNHLLIKHGDVVKAISETIFKFYATELDESLVPIARMKIFDFVVKIMGRDLSDFEKYLIALQLAQAIECRDVLKILKPPSALDTSPGMRSLKRRDG
jgi:hypothetical protein